MDPIEILYVFSMATIDNLQLFVLFNVLRWSFWADDNSRWWEGHRYPARHVGFTGNGFNPSEIFSNILYKWLEVLRHSDFCFHQDEGSWTQEQCLQTGDAFIIVYAITDRSSFLRASDLRIQLRRQREADRTPIILVGNKCDLVRCREVSISGKWFWT